MPANTASASVLNSDSSFADFTSTRSASSIASVSGPKSSVPARSVAPATNFSASMVTPGAHPTVTGPGALAEGSA